MSIRQVRQPGQNAKEDDAAGDGGDDPGFLSRGYGRAKFDDIAVGDWIASDRKGILPYFPYRSLDVVRAVPRPQLDLLVDPQDCDSLPHRTNVWRSPARVSGLEPDNS